MKENESKKITSFDDLLQEYETNHKVENKNSQLLKPKKQRHLFDIGQITSILAFKHDGELYRQYEGAKIIANLEDFVVLLLNKTKVSEKNITWVASDPILFFFAKNRFYNATITLNKNKHNYIYVNLSSPFYIDKGVLKYIDYDIDVKSYIDHEFNVIDWNDFKKSIVNYKYPIELIYRLYDELDFLYGQFKVQAGIFSKKLVNGLEKMLKESGDI